MDEQPRINALMKSHQGWIQCGGGIRSGREGKAICPQRLAEQAPKLQQDKDVRHEVDEVEAGKESGFQEQEPIEAVSQN